MAMKVTPPASPISKMWAMFGWLMAEASLASWTKRRARSESAALDADNTFKATLRPSVVSSAKKTSPMPPAPNRDSIRYRPTRCDAVMRGQRVHRSRDDRFVAHRRDLQLAAHLTEVSDRVSGAPFGHLIQRDNRPWQAHAHRRDVRTQRENRGAQAPNRMPQLGNGRHASDLGRRDQKPRRPDANGRSIEVPLLVGEIGDAGERGQRAAAVDRADEDVGERQVSGVARCGPPARQRLNTAA